MFDLVEAEELELTKSGLIFQLYSRSSGSKSWLKAWVDVLEPFTDVNKQVGTLFSTL